MNKSSIEVGISSKNHHKHEFSVLLNMTNAVKFVLPFVSLLDSFGVKGHNQSHECVSQQWPNHNDT